MNSSTKTFELHAIHNKITIKRNQSGVPVITASNREDLCFGIGYAQASDRLVQMTMVRIIGQGRASELLAGTDELIEIDKYMRWISFERGIDEEIKKLKPDIRLELDAYCAGINEVISKGKRPLEYKLIGYKPEKWEPGHSLLTAKIMGYIGLAQAQGDMEKLLIQLIKHGLDEERIKAIFPYLNEKIDYDLIKQVHLTQEMVPSHIWNQILPNIQSSNNWVVSGQKTKSGKSILATDPHLEINRLPGLWYEMIWKTDDSKMMGITMPGLPVMVMGKSNHLAWGGTYGFMDMIDYFIEDCKDEKFLYDDRWIPFEKRTEILKPKKKEEITLTYYENHHGVLEGTPDVTGKYLAMGFTGREGAGAEIFNIFMRVDSIKSVEEARKNFRLITMPTFNWVFADRDGNIGYQMNGRMPVRSANNSGLLPVPGWLSENDWKGFENPNKFPTCSDPESGYFATANNDLNKFGEVAPINLPMAPYRVQRIMEWLEKSDEIDPDYIKNMHYDFYSKQAERLMTVIAPLLPDSINGNILKNWDCMYTLDSVGATLFESVYENMIKFVFGAQGIGEDTMTYLLTETGILIAFFGNFDDVIMNPDSPWFKNVSRDVQLKEAIDRGLEIRVQKYGDTRKFDMNNMFFDGKLPGFLGFDEKNRKLPGSRATIPQGQIFKFAGRISSFSPSWRMIAEMDKDEILTNIAGGPSGNRFSKWYKSDIENWLNGVYKKLD